MNMYLRKKSPPHQASGIKKDDVWKQAKFKASVRHKAAKKEAALTERHQLISSCGPKPEANRQTAGHESSQVKGAG